MRDEGQTSAVRAYLSIGLAVASGVYGTAFWLTHDAGPDAAAFAPAAKIIRDGYQPRDMILVAPHYATRVFEHLGDLDPLAVREPLGEDFDGHERVWVFGLFGEGTALVARLEAAGLEKTQSWTPSEGITVDLLTTPVTNEVHYDFLERLHDAKVHHEKNGTKVACDQWTNGRGHGRWQCPYDKDWFYVAPEFHQMGDHMRFCLWAHPPGEGRLLVSYPNVPLHGRIYGRAGHTLNGSVNARAAIDLDVSIGDDPPQRFVFALEDYYEPFMVRTGTATTATVTFAISTVDAGVNHFCWRADSRTARELEP